MATGPTQSMHALHGLNFAWGELRNSEYRSIVRRPSTSTQSCMHAYCTLPHLRIPTLVSLATSLAPHETDTYIIMHVVLFLPLSPPHTCTLYSLTPTLHIFIIRTVQMNVKKLKEKPRLLSASLKTSWVNRYNSTFEHKAFV